MASSFFRSRAFLLSSLSVPAAALLLKTYLYNNPLSASKTRTVTTTETLSPTSALSPSLKIINPSNHIIAADSRSIRLSVQEIRNLSDEEILVRFLKGFFGGWIFTPERGLIAAIKTLGLEFVPLGFTGIQTRESTLILSEFSVTSLPPRHALLFGGNFIVLDHHVGKTKPEVSSTTSKPTAPSFLEIGFGDDRKQFAGMHRFEVSRDNKVDGKDGDGVTVCFSSLSCNPTVNKLPFPNWVFKFHKFYAQCLFRDGIREVLRQ